MAGVRGDIGPKGDTGPKGDSVTAARRNGSTLVFTVAATDLTPISLPEVDSLAGWRDQAQNSATNAAKSATDAKKWADAAVGAVLPDDGVAAPKLKPEIRASLAKADTASQPGHSHAITDVTGLQTAIDSKEPSGAAANAIATVRDSAPTALDTLKKLAAAIGNDASYAATTAATIGAKYTKPAGGVPTSDLADQAVTTAKLADGAVTTAKLATGRVTGSDQSGPRSLTLWVGTEAQYTALASKDPNTVYLRTA
ncbi:hypothetical protein D5S18_02920 [Nocardia panacis]|uniref:Minor tail protein gp31 C-terminal domain-containing protein n=2 Tax=Nocardia panacis TaxID=2340916 RepID=A0A3A4KI58_9NOCA|nr:hypothetical protein D5S18_02920 [Nocardia panacis]